MRFRFYHPDGQQGYDENRDEKTFRMLQQDGMNSEKSPGPYPPPECFAHDRQFMLHHPETDRWWVAQYRDVYLWSKTEDLSGYMIQVYPDKFDEVFL